MGGGRRRGCVSGLGLSSVCKQSVSGTSGQTEKVDLFIIFMKYFSFEEIF